LRLPDFYMRVHAITKAGTLGVGLLLVGVAVHFGDLSVTTRALAIILFVLITAPVSSHMIGRAGYLEGVSLWDGTVLDEWHASFSEMHYEEDTIEQPNVPLADTSADTGADADADTGADAAPAAHGATNGAAPSDAAAAAAASSDAAAASDDDAPRTPAPDAAEPA
jgi:multicomponent Na+:H+ antiporter subunit G